jgi:amylosucrase
MKAFEAVCRTFREAGISVCVDMVLNHTAKEHDWAKKRPGGDPKYRDYYHFFPDDRLPKAYEETLVEVFPENAPGSFTHYPEIGQWVWTTFNEHQWDLNWANPWVFLEMVEVMLYLSNRGVDVLRFDAVAFMWKRMGTRCQSEPEVHMILQALRAANRIVAPSVIHLEEAIVGPSEMIPYLGRGEHSGKEGNLAYHNSLMVQVWSSLAARDTRMMAHVLRTHFPPVVPNATYATYLRCHDDIGWAVTDEDAAAVGWDGGAPGLPVGLLRGRVPGQLLARRAVPGEPGHRRQADQRHLRLARRAREGRGRGRPRGHRPGGGPHPDGARADRELRGDTADLHGRRDRAAERPLLRLEPRSRPRQPVDPPAANGLGGGGGAGAGRHAGVAGPCRGPRILARRAAVPAFHGGYPTVILDAADRRVFAFSRQAPFGTVLCLYNFSEAWTGVSGRLVSRRGRHGVHRRVVRSGRWRPMRAMWRCRPSRGSGFGRGVRPG